MTPLVFVRYVSRTLQQTRLTAIWNTIYILDVNIITLMMTSARVDETLGNVITNTPSEDYTHPDDHTSPTYDMTPGARSVLETPDNFLGFRAHYLSANGNYWC